MKPRNLTDLHRDARGIDVADDAERTDVLDVINSLSLMANDAADAGQPDDGRIDVPDAGQPNAGQAEAGQPDDGRMFTLLTEPCRAELFPSRILGLLWNGTQQCKEISLAECKERDGRLLYGDSVYVPDHPPLRLQLLQDHHDPPALGHPGRAKILELLTRKYFRPSIRKDVH